MLIGRVRQTDTRRNSSPPKRSTVRGETLSTEYLLRRVPPGNNVHAAAYRARECIPT